MTWFYFLVSYSFLAFFGSGVCYAVFWLDQHSLIVIVAAASLYLFNYNLKALIKIDRLDPHLPLIMGHSMPCAQCSVVMFLTAYWTFCYWRYAREVWGYATLTIRTILILGYAALFVTSRLVLKYNTADDVLVSILIASVWLVAFLRILKKKPKEFIKDD